VDPACAGASLPSAASAASAALAVASAGCALVSIHGTTMPSGCITFTCRHMNHAADRFRAPNATRGEEMIMS
jgi:hypothetical protein